MRCQSCCRFPEQDSLWSPLLAKEEIALAAAQGIPPAIITLNGRIRPEPQGKEDLYLCPLLNPCGNTCKVYPAHPFECQLYPFLLQRQDKRVFLAVDENCPYVAEHSHSREFKEYCEYLRRVLNYADYQAFFSNNPQLIQEYPNVTILAELEA